MFDLCNRCCINTLKELQEFLTKTEISVTSDDGYTMEVYGISDFERCSLHW